MKKTKIVATALLLAGLAFSAEARGFEVLSKAKEAFKHHAHHKSHFRYPKGYAMSLKDGQKLKRAYKLGKTVIGFRPKAAKALLKGTVKAIKTHRH